MKKELYFKLETIILRTAYFYLKGSKYPKSSRYTQTIEKNKISSSNGNIQRDLLVSDLKIKSFLFICRRLC